MPTYTFRRMDGTTLNRRLSFTEYEEVKSGDKKLVDADGADLALVFDPSGMNFILKDGESGGWASKAMKENKHRVARREAVAKRERDHVFKSRLVPNYQGKEAHCWDDVRDHVHVTKGEVAAQTYDHLVAQEKT